VFADADLGADGWLERLGRVVQSLGGPAFEGELLALLNEILPIDHCVVFTYSEDGLGHLFTHGKMPAERARELADDYVRHYHARDPLYAALTDGTPGALDAPRPLDLHADYDPAYRNHFFDRNGLVDKTSVIGRLERDRVLCNFFRMEGTSPYSADERRRLERVLPLVAGLVAAHYRLARPQTPAGTGTAGERPAGAETDPADGPHVQTLDRTRSLVRTVVGTRVPPFDRLTARERDVCERILLGYTSMGIGLDLKIALSSVLTYRKRAYQKLGIGTQNELFALCLAATRR
jgi:DNA-binding CsgD family transcriptional regulator